MIGVAVALVVLSLLNGCVGKGDPDEGWVVVELAHTNDKCIIRSIEVSCAEAPSYLRDRLRIPLGAHTKLKCRKPCTRTDEMPALMDALAAAGYQHLIGELED